MNDDLRRSAHRMLGGMERSVVPLDSFQLRLALGLVRAS